jgi:hypothetical protein
MTTTRSTLGVRFRVVVPPLFRVLHVFIVVISCHVLGQMPQKKRAAMLEKFRTVSEGQKNIFIVSFKNIFPFF